MGGKTASRSIYGTAYHDDADFRELLLCTVAGVNISVRAPFHIHKALGPFSYRMAGFSGTGSPDLTLDILPPGPGGTIRQQSQKASLTFDYLSQSLPSRSIDHPLVRQLPVRLENLIGEVSVESLFQEPIVSTSRGMVVPLSDGVLLGGPERERATLLLYSPLKTIETWEEEIPWWTAVNITVINSVMAFLSLHMARKNGLLVHGIGLSHEGQGFLYVAPSRGGKTTLAMHSPPGTVLADDGIILKEMGGEYRIYPTPFRQRSKGRGRTSLWCAKPLKLRALFFLEQGSDVHLTPISHACALNRLIGSYTHFYPWMDRLQTRSTFDFWYQLGKRVPMASLAWRPGLDIWQEIEHYLA